MSNAENSDMVEVEPAPSPAPRIEYRQSNNKKTAINKYFFVQHLNGLPTDKRQCIRCGILLRHAMLRLTFNPHPMS